MRVDPNSIYVSPDRQRSELDPKQVGIMKNSFERIGQLQPIIIRDSFHEEDTDGKELVLIAGANRLQAAIELDWKTIEAVKKKSLDPIDHRIIELEENVKRSDLTWQQQARAICSLHDTMQEVADEVAGWSVEKTAAMIGFSVTHTHRYIRVGRYLDKDQRVAASSGLEAASNLIERIMTRAMDKELSILDSVEDAALEPAPETETASDKEEGIVVTDIDSGIELDMEGEEPKVEMPKAEGPAPSSSTLPSKQQKQSIEASVNRDILNTNFHEWAATYKGKKFDFVNCDFPYGINFHKSDQGNAEVWNTYEDTPDIYFQLCESFVKHKSNFLSSSSHVFFWFSMKHYNWTIDFFEEAGFRVQPVPCVWYKSDGKGILPDPKRGPRQIWESALILSLGDRYIIRSVGNVYAAPTAKSAAKHVSEKNEAMLRHFFQMFVDSTTEMFDPTCGSGSALRAAESLGAKRVLGLEQDPEMAETAQLELLRHRRLAAQKEG